ncbi:hypothetical protein SARC_03596 [Sphaeroforma arctica JP610]|uniref:FMN hydroxy acid dehydrogenase domain-containing protein n=1 Tax=Sphaeroforma arctica JP610 TaxID=667725 RepID=A0A0L0G5G8_9EUKA|nr:hypothetical protein SARC_03596 [Sphaeroforma arctica JP610]KNC84174.1 hypothetical protein SARC_03596 [Sphaeroforma arctica JP610]|eukprot:XP_014158076.1 hypothetical protein SARC_03596 [Sphaeroforma arctica JP610]
MCISPRQVLQVYARTGTRAFRTAAVALRRDAATPSSSDAFQERLFNVDDVAERRKENQQLYPPREVLKAMLPDMGLVGAVQWQSYWDGVYGKIQDVPLDVERLEKKFVETVSPDCTVWLFGRAGLHDTYRSNMDDFNRWKIVPRMLTGVTAADLTTRFTMMGKSFTMATPLSVAPVGVQARVTYPDMTGDLYTAAAAAEIGVPFVISTVSSQPIEKIVETVTNTNILAPKPWFQLYNSSVTALSVSYLKRAKAAGCEAIVLTLDTTKYGYRTEELDAGYFPQADVRIPWGQGRSDPTFNGIMKGQFNSVASEQFSDDGKYEVSALKTNMLTLATVGVSAGDVWDKEKVPEPVDKPHQSIDWMVDFVQGELDLPLVLKGIQHPDDARMAVRKGVSGLVVSNHGGRQADGCISTIAALPAVIAAVRDEAKALGKDPIPVFVDSGFRCGAHILKALALGATGVWVGRIPMMGTAVGGQDGAKRVLQGLLCDLDCTMVNAGIADVHNIKSDTLVEDR